jgi:hypothetical protein
MAGIMTIFGLIVNLIGTIMLLKYGFKGSHDADYGAMMLEPGDVKKLKRRIMGSPMEIKVNRENKPLTVPRCKRIK